MRLLNFLLPLLGATAALLPNAEAARKSSGTNAASARQSRFLADARANKGFVELDATSFNELTQTPRNYSVTALLTANAPSFRCQPCLTFQPEFEAVARAWQKNPSRDRHIFGKIEFMEGREIFRRFGLSHAPALYFFPATEGPFASTSAEPVSYDFNRLGFEGSDFAAELSATLGTKVPYSKPLPWRLIAAGVAAMAVAGTLVMLFAGHVSVLASSKALWQLVSLGTMVVMCSGYMWNTIRTPPYVMMGPAGKVEYIAGGFQNQYGAETQIVAAIYALLAFSFVALTILVPAQRDPVRQRAGVYIWSAIFIGTFSLLFALFRMKNPSYPFRLLF